MRIRQAETTDTTNLAVLATQVWLDTYATQGIRSSISGYVLHDLVSEKFEHVFQEKTSLIWVLEDQDHLIGFIELNMKSPCPIHGDTYENIETEIVRLYIQKPFCGKGFGQQLLAQAEDYCLQQKIQTLWLSVWIKDQRAMEFYENNQFICEGKTLFQLDDECHENLVFVKQINHVR